MTEPSPAASPDARTAPPRDDLAVTRHRATLAGEEIGYTVTTGTLVLKREREGEGDAAGRFQGHAPHAEVFFVAYTRDDPPGGAAGRPVTFSFNGGPGSSSVWLHLGLLGPKRVRFEDDGTPTPPPYQLVDNEHTLFGASDLVFVDPVSTGYSRPVTGEKAGEFHDFDADIASVGEFIRLWCSRYRRWNSAKFLIGESYGTIRAAGLAGHLQERHGMYLNGVMLVSSILDYATARFEPGNDLPPLLFLPTYAATAHFHGRLEPALQQRPLRELLDEVEAFALERYAPALLRGSSLPPDEFDAVAALLARYTGLPVEVVRRNRLRLDIFRFTKELLRDEHRTVGRLDSRFVGIDRDAGGERFEYDPSYATIQGPFTAAFNDYVRGELGFESDLPYEILSLDVNRNWRYDAFHNRYLRVADTLRRAMSLNPHLKVHVASGYYDLATPYFATRHTLDHLALDPALHANLSVSHYEAGHMMYVQRASLAALNEALEAFVREAAGS